VAGRAVVPGADAPTAVLRGPDAGLYGQALADPLFRARFEAAYTGDDDPLDALWWLDHPREAAPSGAAAPAARAAAARLALYGPGTEPAAVARYEQAAAAYGGIPEPRPEPAYPGPEPGFAPPGSRSSWPTAAPLESEYANGHSSDYANGHSYQGAHNGNGNSNGYGYEQRLIPATPTGRRSPTRVEITFRTHGGSCRCISVSTRAKLRRRRCGGPSLRREARRS